MADQPTHSITVAPAAAQIVDGNGLVSELPKPRTAGQRARCRCGWRGPERSSAEQAAQDGKAHVGLHRPTHPATPGRR